jgi:hypothetical protein
MNRKGRSKVRAQTTAETPAVVHPDLLAFDIRRPLNEWPESVRKLAEERARAATETADHDSAKDPDSWREPGPEDLAIGPLAPNECPHPTRSGRHEIYTDRDGDYCRACGVRFPLQPATLAPLPLVEDRSLEQIVADGDGTPEYLVKVAAERLEASVDRVVDTTARLAAAVGIESTPPEARVTQPMTAPDEWGRYRMVRQEPDEDEPTTPTLFDPAVADGILAKLESDPHLRQLVARYMATNHALTQATGSAPAAQLHVDTAGGRCGACGQFDLGFNDLWNDRLKRMAAAADCTPRLYLNRLLARAWAAMPRKERTT